MLQTHSEKPCISPCLKSWRKLKISIGNPLNSEENNMAKVSKVQTEATLLRFNVNPNQLLEEYAIWTLELPTLFRDALWQFKTDVQNRLKSMGKGENIYIPSRQLNNALMAMFPTLVHGFEDVGKKPLSTPCVAIVQSSESFQIPDPENL